MAEHRAPGRPAPGVASLQDIPTSAPELRFAVRFPAVPGDERRAAVLHGADAPHPLAGTGKLFLAMAVARLAERDRGLLARPLTIGAEHRAAARSGTLRRMTGDLQLTVDDALALVVGTGDGACVAALLELFAARVEDVLAEAQRTASGLGLGSTTFTGVESSDHDPGGETGESWGEGLIGTTTPDDLCMLLEHLVAAAVAEAEAAVADRVLAWMGKTFEPAGLASALPGFGPRTIPHRTVSGFELLTPPGAPGCASVLVLPADVGTGRPAACVAAYHPRTRDDGSSVSSREVGAVLGSLGLAVERSIAAIRA